MYPTVVEWNTEHVTYCGGVEIQNMSLTVVEWKLHHSRRHVLYFHSTIVGVMFCIPFHHSRRHVLYFHSTTVSDMFCISTPPQ
jgi:hypothetical protein